MAYPHIGGFLAGRLAASIGFWMERIALGWLVWEATQSPGWVGTLAFIRLAPAAFFGPWGGVLADRYAAVTVLRRSSLLLAAVMAALAALVWAGQTMLAPMMIFACISGALQSLTTGPMKSAISDITPRRLLPTAVPVASVTFNLAAFIGPALGGAVLVVLGAEAVFALAALGMLVFSLTLLPIPTESCRRGARAGAVRAFGDATKMAHGDPVIGPQLTLHLALSTLLRPIQDLLPAVTGLLLVGGPASLARMTAAMGIGALVGSVWLTLRSGSGNLGARVLGAAGLASAGTLALALAQNEVQALFFIAVLGAAMVVRGAGSNTIVQLNVDDAMRGRVMALSGTILRIASALGALALGLLAELMGLRMTLILAALIAGVLIVVLLPRLFAPG